MRFAWIIIVVALVMAFWVSPALAHGESPSSAPPQWVFFYSLHITFNGVAVNEGAVVGAVVARTGQECGAQRVVADGVLPLLACHVENPAAGQSGVRGGDTVFFLVDGVAVNESITLPSMIQNGDLFELTGNWSSQEGAASCQDGYETNDTQSEARELTGPESHNLISTHNGWDQDWTWFGARPGWVYQITAHVPHAVLTVPFLRLFDAQGMLLAENKQYWENDAEIWWWNGGPEQRLFIQVTEANGTHGCGYHYTLSLVPWSPGEFEARFGQK